MKKTNDNFGSGLLGQAYAQKGLINISVYDVAKIAICYIMARCNLFKDMLPLGIASYAAFFGGQYGLLCLVAASLGTLRQFMNIDALPYICAMVSVTILFGFTAVGSKVLWRALASSVALFLSLWLRRLVGGFYLFDVLISAFEGALCFGGVYLFSMAVPVLLHGKERSYLSDVEMVCIIGTMALFVRCLGDMPRVFSVDVSQVVALVLLLMINLEGEVSYGAAMGAVLGVVGATDYAGVLQSTGAYVLASMSAGFLKRFGRVGLVLGLTFANAVLAVLLPSETLPFDVFEVIAASVIFAVLPQKITAYVSSFPAKAVHSAADLTVSRDKLQKIICRKLRKLSDSFSALSYSYSKCFSEQRMSKQYVIHMLDSASCKICPGCGLKYNCWERGYKTSYNSMLKMLEVADKKGSLSSVDVPREFASRCTKIDDFVDAFNRMYDTYKIEKLWQSRLNESRMLVSGQMKGVSRTVANMSGQFAMCLDVPAEKELKTALDRNGICVCDVTVLKGHGNDFSVDLYFKDGNIRKKDEKTIVDTIYEVTGVKTVLKTQNYVDNRIAVTFCPRFEYGISTGVATAIKYGESVSGDSNTVCKNDFDETVVAISDGMGTGANACQESSTAIELLNNFINAGMDVETSLELINSSLLLRSSGESFATMDVCIFRLSDGVICFSKSGAAPSYVKNEYGISKVESEDLPFGVVENGSEVKSEIFSVDENALVVMMSDGVSDVYMDGEHDRLLDKLKAMDITNPQVIASTILNGALELSGKKAKDDMTVVAVSIWKN